MADRSPRCPVGAELAGMMFVGVPCQAIRA
jgi:hypothetical protein